MADQRTIGVLLLNTGTPDAPTTPALRQYLSEFLSDPKVIDYPRWLWLPILNQIILRVRPARSAALYQRIWTAAGSPLLSISQSLADKLTHELERQTGDRFVVALGMRYGAPSIQQGLAALRAARPDALVILPLYPQYSETTTGTSLEATEGALSGWFSNVQTHIIRDYYQHPAYVDGLADSIRAHWAHAPRPERLLFSFHGIPARYTTKGDPYQSQCEASATLVAAALELTEGEWSMAYQSRFGPEPWLKPYTDDVLEHWGAQGPAHIQALCPGFAIDCLETVDEIGHEAREAFIAAGGEQFDYIPALNDSAHGIKLYATLIGEALQ